MIRCPTLGCGKPGLILYYKFSLDIYPDFINFFHITLIGVKIDGVLTCKCYLCDEFFFSVYLTTTVQMIYNLLYYQVVAQVSLGLSRTERERVKQMSSSDGNVRNLTDALGLIHDYIGHTDLYIEDDSMDSSSKPQVNMVALEQQVRFSISSFWYFW